MFAIDLPLASVIPPSPDQTASLANAVAQAQAQGSTVLAAAGNAPGAIELPASQPGIFAVGAGDTTNGGICSFSASASLTFFAPGCFIDTIDRTSDAPLCCGNGTSQASAFTAGVLVALRSYDPALTAAKAVQLLLSTTVNGHLDVAAAFRADNLGPIVDAGNAAIPKPPPTPTPASPTPTPPASQPAATPAPTVPLPLVRSATWRRGVLRIALVGLPAGARLHVKITFAHRKPRYYATSHTSLHRRTPASTTGSAPPDQGRRRGRYGDGEALMRPLLRTILTVVATTTCVAALVSTAFAGSYVVSTCSPFSTPGVWTQVNTGAPGLTAGQSCGGPAIGPMGGGDQGALYGEDTTNGTSRDIANGAAAGWTFTAPPQTTITAISYYRSLATFGSEDFVAGLFQADGSPLEQCVIPSRSRRGPASSAQSRTRRPR